MNNLKQKLGTLVLGLLVISATHFFNLTDDGSETRFAPQLSNATPNQDRLDSTDLDAILKAYQNRQSDLIVEGAGTVIKVLPDDNEGSRHQRLLLRLNNDLTLLIAHNIDLAPRVEHLQSGDTLGFKGEYEWNEKGGVVHWTHHDPQGRHTGGWLDHNGKRYQ